LTISKVNKKFIYLISPNKVKNNNFYSQLKKIFKSNKIAFFQLRLKKESKKKKLLLEKKYINYVKNTKLSILLMMILFLQKSSMLMVVILVKMIWISCWQEKF
tara:strand:- start:2564 stop:2872 length:309 start_codon:yes stop_codon:yes gene_type:complete